MEHGETRGLGGGGDDEVDRLRAAVEARRGHRAGGLERALHDLGGDRRLGQDPPLLDDFSHVASPGGVDDLEVDQPAGPQLAGLRQSRQASGRFSSGSSTPSCARSTAAVSVLKRWPVPAL
jgi:hypothetical protein